MSANIIEMPSAPQRKSARGEPTWEIAQFYPRQGEWTDEEYLTLSVNRFVELHNGILEVLAMPTALHQAIVGLLYELLRKFLCQQNVGQVFLAPMPVRLGPGQYREPDLVFLKPERLRTLQAIGLQGQPDGADLTMEVVSPGDENRRRDVVEKREIYARAGIAEYWIIDPETATITVLVLDGTSYRVHGEFHAPATATSVLLSGFTVNVHDVFAVGSLPG